MDPKQWKMCGNKIRYRTKKSALNYLHKNIRRKGYIIPSTANAYLCPYCEYYHLGHNKFSLLMTSKNS